MKQSNQIKRHCFTLILVLAFTITLLPLPAKAVVSTAACYTYMDVLKDQKASIPVEPWMALRGEEAGSQDKKENLKSIAFKDLDGDGTDELILLTVEDNPQGWILEKHVFLNIYTFTDGTAKQVYSSEIISGGGTSPMFFKVYQITGKNELFAHVGSSHASSSGSSYYSFSLKNGMITQQELKKSESYGMNGNAYTYKLDDVTISEAEYSRKEVEMRGPVADLLFDSGSANDGQSGMLYDDAVAYLNTIAITNSVGVKVNSDAVQWTDAVPFIDNNSRTMVPLRAVAEALGLAVSWDGVKREASFTNGSKTLYFPIGSSTARTSDGGAIQMDTAAVIVNDRTYAPIRYLAEYFGFAVDWDGSNRTVLIQGALVSPVDMGMESATVTWERLTHIYHEELQNYDVEGYGEYIYDLATITDSTEIAPIINDLLREEYDSFVEKNPVFYPAYYGDTSKRLAYSCYDGCVTNNSNGILSISYTPNGNYYYGMNGFGREAAHGITISLKTGDLLHLSDFKTSDGRQITFQMMEDIAVAYYQNTYDIPSKGIADSLQYFRKKSLDDLKFYIQDSEIMLVIDAYTFGIPANALIPTGIYIKAQ